MADLIKLLPDHVANQIAAGEVVQRPASVVKELLENAIDAGASSIKLIVKDGGKTLIQVVDDGSGMGDTDARLSFERHATSKITKAEDLFALNTKGFRGEALASIAAIAHVEMQTKPYDQELGTLIKIAGSEVQQQEATVCPPGTSMAVKNLFFNIPARRNFLKSDAVELRHITDEFHRVALAHPGIRFGYFNNGSELFNLPATSHRQRIVHIFGTKTNERLVPVEEDTQVARISGFVLKPEFAKKSRGSQFFFVNNRFIKSSYLNHAVQAAFEGLVKSDVHPGYFLYLDVPPEAIDINIHPTKTEIKFEDEHSLYAILRAAVKHSLGQFNVAPVLDFEHNQNLEVPYDMKDSGAAQPRVTVDANFNPFASPAPVAKGRTATTRTHFQKPSTQGWENMFEGLESKMGGTEHFSSLSFESEAVTGQMFDDGGEDWKAVTTFQLKRKYVVSSIKSGLLVLDQGRAHQRILYEKFLRDITVQEAVSQQLLFPIELHFTPDEVSLIQEIRESLVTMGFQFETVADEKVVIGGVPLLVPESGVSEVLERLLADYQLHGSADGFSQSDTLAKTMCKSLAVKTGEVLDQDSQLALVNDLFACTETQLSPFDKPIYITITEADIDKKFI